MKRTQQHRRHLSRRNRLDFNSLETRIMLANDVLPDIFAWEDVNRGYLHDYVVEGDLLRFTTAFANQGAGHLEVFGGDVLGNGNQEVLQRIYDDEGGFRDRVAGEFTYHASHGHIHFDGYAIYNLREIGPSGEVGAIVATGGKISFCLIDITKYDTNAGSSNYGSCGTTQGVSAGWSDVYSRGLADQWINISGVDDGDYYLEVVTDPENQLLESDETNNTTIITVTIQDGPGAQGDRFEPNNTFAAAHNMGMFSDRVEAGLSIHTDQDVDYYQFNAVDHGEFEIHVNFSHGLGNIDAFVYDFEFNLIASGDSVDDLEDLHFHSEPEQAYYLKIVGAGGATNGYDLEFFGPGEVITDTVMSGNVPVDIPDSGGSSTPGETVTSTLEGIDVTLTDLNLVFEDLQHSYLGDLHIDLTSPAGTTVTIIRSTWESASGPLGGEDDFINTFMDDQAPTNIDDGTAPFSGSFNVNFGDVSSPLSVFNGESALGTWTVSITDWFRADTGTLNAWGLMFTGIDNNPGDALEQNDAFPQATDLGVIGTTGFTELSIHNQSDVDFFRFTAQDSTHVQIDLGFVHDNGNLDLIVYDSNQQEIARADTINDNEFLLIPVEQDELYYIEVFGLENATNDYTFEIDVPQTVATTGKIGLVDSRWQTVMLESHFDNPVVFVSTPGVADHSPVTVEIENVTSNSFDVRLHNWHLKVPNHGAEDLTYFVVESGSHTLRDGTKLVAGRLDANDTTWSHVGFSESFSSTPVVFTQLDHSSPTAHTSRLNKINENGFNVLVQGAELYQPKNLTFDTHWMAIEPGTGASDNGVFDVGNTGGGVTHLPEKFQFTTDFSASPQLIMSLQTSNEMDTAGIRLSNNGTQYASIFIEEETSFDDEQTHAAEDVGYLAFSVYDNFYALETQTSGKGFLTDTSQPVPIINTPGRVTTLPSPISKQIAASGSSTHDKPILDASIASSLDFNGVLTLDDGNLQKQNGEAIEPQIPSDKKTDDLSLVSVDSLAIDSLTVDSDLENRTEAVSNHRSKQTTSFLQDRAFEEFRPSLNQR